VEACVLILVHWLIGHLRDRRFYNLAELDAAVGQLLTRLNEERPIRRLGGSRRHLLEEFGRPVLKSSPTEPYVFAEGRVRQRTSVGLPSQPWPKTRASWQTEREACHALFATNGLNPTTLRDLTVARRRGRSKLR
jgi:hypothetical protein